jgi:hypothetical protein
MRDILVIVTTSGFSAFCVGYIRLCDRITGGDPDPDPDATTAARSAVPDEVPA